jgi:Xaa-Pro aminopeptidase
MYQLETKIKAAVQESKLDAVLVFGSDNFNYLTRTVLPFAEHNPNRRAAALLPKEGSPVIVCPPDWSQAIQDQGWKGETISYDENSAFEGEALVNSLEELLVSLGLDRKKIGFDASRATKATMDRLQRKAPGVEWMHADQMIASLRLVKTLEEVTYIERACKQTDMGIVWALMHLEGAVKTPGYNIAEFTERIRVHINENGASGVGLLNTAFGTDGQIYYTPQRGWVKDGELFRMDVSAHYMGYWANLGRMGVVGTSSPEQEAAYSDNLRLKAAALEMMKPGVACNEVYAHVARAAERQAVGLWKEPGIGHGVGASHHEAPYLSLGCSMVLQPGMTLALDIYTYGPRQELIHSKDVYLITEEGNRKLSWYRSWDSLYAVTGWRATH